MKMFTTTKYSQFNATRNNDGVGKPDLATHWNLHPQHATVPAVADTTGRSPRAALSCPVLWTRVQPRKIYSDIRR